MTKGRATAIGFVAVVLWSLLALFTVGTLPVPPLQLNAMAFAIGGFAGSVWIIRTGGLSQLRGVSWRVYAFGTAGLFGYHLLYFSALRLAPAAEAGLIAYLWPLLIVLFSGLLPSEHLRAGHIAGAAISFSGAALIVTGSGVDFSTNALPGFGLALLCALTWAGYSVLSRRMGQVPTAAVAVFCLATSALSLPLHLVFEETIWPAHLIGWGAIVALGLGPVGLAFYVWDIGVKRGDIQLLGTSAYAAPLLSTLVLVLAGIAKPSLVLAGAAILITAGAAIAARSSARISQNR
ncbi:MAG: EamA family transporter [Rhodobacteraceae bacterium]|nr:EamA family transporter [Paracoccaceae bacterium]